MQNKFFQLNREVESLKQELYYLLDTKPWAKHDILKISKRIDDLIIKFYND